MICTSIQNKNYGEILEILAEPMVEMAEIRLDRCTLTDEEIEDLFGNSDVPLIATCRIAEAGEQQAWRLLKLAIESGARFSDLEIEAPANMSKSFQKLCHECGTEIIRSYHNFEQTPSDDELQKALARCFRYGADIAKIVTTCNSVEDAARIEALYTILLEDIDSLQGRLVAFGMGSYGKITRLECLKRGAPFTYCALSEQEATAPGQWTAAAMYDQIYKDRPVYERDGLVMPASKSFAQRAIIAAALAEGTSHLSGYSPCGDSEAAIMVAEGLGAKVERNGSVLAITGIGASYGSLDLETLKTGESGLLTRLIIPILSAVNAGPFTIEGEGTLLRRPLNAASDIMAAFGVLLSNAAEHEGKDLFVPLKSKGKLIPGTADISGKAGSQLISGLLMALPLCAKDSNLFVAEPKSIPYMYITLDVLRHFGIQTRSEMEGDAEMLEAQDWSYCTGINFKIRGGQKYKAADFSIEGDWSAAANFLVAGAIYGSAEISGLDPKSLQADITIMDILVEAGAVVSQIDDESGAANPQTEGIAASRAECTAQTEGTAESRAEFTAESHIKSESGDQGSNICIRKAPLEAFTQDLNNAPDLFPIVALLAAFCAGESRIAGVGRLASKESDRASAIVGMLTQMGVDASIDGDIMVIGGESLTSRILNGRLLKGGSYTSHHDHRMVMALKVASLASDSPIVIDDEACVAKSFPDFLELFG